MFHQQHVTIQFLESQEKSSPWFSWQCPLKTLVSEDDRLFWGKKLLENRSSQVCFKYTDVEHILSCWSHVNEENYEEHSPPHTVPLKGANTSTADWSMAVFLAMNSMSSSVRMDLPLMQPMMDSLRSPCNSKKRIRTRKVFVFRWSAVWSVLEFLSNLWGLRTD